MLDAHGQSWGAVADVMTRSSSGCVTTRRRPFARATPALEVPGVLAGALAAAR
jgi:hypothetical protein